MTAETIGFIGLGNIGRPMADNLARAGHAMVVYDIAGTEARAPDGARAAASVEEVAENSTISFLCLPTVDAFDIVVSQIAAASTTESAIVCSVSTVGPTAAARANERLRASGIDFVDAPVSGNVLRAETGELTIMFSGSDAAFARTKPLFETIGSNVFEIGPEPGQGQRMKLVNNYLVISAFVINSEAFAYGESGGLKLETMLDVVNVSTGQNFVSEHLFPRYVLTGSYDSRGAAAIVRKDLSLYMREAEAAGRKRDVARAVLDVIEEFDDAEPDSDQMRIYPYVRDRR